MSAAKPSDSPRAVRFVRAAAMAAATADCVLLAVHMSAAPDVSSVLTAHAGVTLAAAGGLRLAGVPWSQVCFWGALLGFGGPPAAAILSISKARDLARSKRTDLVAPLRAYQAALAAPETTVDQLHEDIVTGRRPCAAPGAVGNLRRALDSGDPLHEQAAIAKIARSYHPRMAGSLAQALRADSSIARVQAAAVHVGLQERARAAAREVAARAGNCSCVAALDVIEPLLAGGLLPSQDRARLLDLAIDAHLRERDANAAREADRTALDAAIAAGFAEGDDETRRRLSDRLRQPSAKRSRLLAGRDRLTASPRSAGYPRRDAV